MPSMNAVICSGDCASVVLVPDQFGRKSAGVYRFPPDDQTFASTAQIVAAAASMRSWTSSGPKVRSNAAHSPRVRAGSRSAR